jgi:hypothetical protein
VDFEEIYRATYPRVLAYARSMASREDADDAVVDAAWDAIGPQKVGHGRPEQPKQG